MRVCMQNEGLRIGEKVTVSDEKQKTILLFSFHTRKCWSRQNYILVSYPNAYELKN